MPEVPHKAAEDVKWLESWRNFWKTSINSKMKHTEEKQNLNLKNLAKESRNENPGQPKVEYLSSIIYRSKMIHMWPQEKSSLSQSLVHHFFVWTLFTILSVYCGSLVLKALMDFKTVDEVAGTIDFATTSISGTFRYMYVYLRGKKYLEIVSTMNENFIYYSLFPGSKKASIEKYQKLTNRIIFAYTFSVFVWAPQVILMPLFTHIKLTTSNHHGFGLNSTNYQNYLPVNSYIPFDVSQLSWYIFSYIFQGFNITALGVIYVIVDSFWITIILLTVAQFDMIKASLDTLIEDTNSSDTETQVELLNRYQTEEVEAKLTQCIRHHEFIKRFVRIIEDVFNPNVLINILHAIISIAFILLEITVVINNKTWNKLFNLIQFFCISIIHMIVYDWLGNELLIKEEEVQNAVYNLSWYKYPSQKEKIIIMLQLSGKSTKLTGGKIYKMTLEFFVNTIKLIFSYFSFLLQIRNGN